MANDYKSENPKHGTLDSVVKTFNSVSTVPHAKNPFVKPSSPGAVSTTPSASPQKKN